MRPPTRGSAFIAVRDAAAGYGGHIVAIPRDNLPVLTKEDGKTPLWNAGDAWTPVTTARERSGAQGRDPDDRRAELPGRRGQRRGCRTRRDRRTSTSSTGFPSRRAFSTACRAAYARILTLEDGLIGTVDAGLRGFAAYAPGKLAGCGVDARSPRHRRSARSRRRKRFLRSLGALRHDRRRHRGAARGVT